VISTVRSLAIQPSIFPDSRKTALPGALSQMEIAGLLAAVGSEGDPTSGGEPTDIEPL
jgi:hypothetical protein